MESLFVWGIGKIPFVWKPLKKDDLESEIPQKLPFTLCLSPVSGTITQKPNDVVTKALELAYLKGSEISGVMDDDESSKGYADDFLAFLKKSCLMDRFDGMRVLDIGCGTGYLLYRLKQLGAKVVGIEPGIQGKEGNRRYDIPIVSDFFPSEKIEGMFDIIILSLVLEHIQEPLLFLQLVKHYLKRTGRVLISVEDEKGYLEKGDVSILFHEHYSYFTERTLRNSLILSGFDNIDILNSSFSVLLYAIAEGNALVDQLPKTEIDECNRIAYQYKRKALSKNTAIGKLIVDSFQNNKTIGIYVPGRIVNLLEMEKLPVSHIRFFDDNPKLFNTYFPGVDIPIESGEELFKKPTDIVLIMSNSFGEQIAGRLKKLLPSESQIITWHELFY
jgi:SAM-dependent methyltransferase